MWTLHIFFFSTQHAKWIDELLNISVSHTENRCFIFSFSALDTNYSVWSANSNSMSNTIGSFLSSSFSMKTKKWEKTRNVVFYYSNYSTVSSALCNTKSYINRLWIISFRLIERWQPLWQNYRSGLLWSDQTTIVSCVCLYA